MERLGVTFARAPLLYGWHAIATWARHLPEGSAVWRAEHPRETAFSSELARASIMADQFDATMQVIVAIAKAHGSKRVRTPKPYPRPWNEPEGHVIGKGGGIPVRDFDAWYYDES